MFVSKIKCVFAVQECKWLCLYVLRACEGKFKARKNIHQLERFPTNSEISMQRICAYKKYSM